MRYYTCGAGGNFSHHVLLEDSIIQRIGSEANASDLFCSVQTYDIHGIELASQLVFDIDNESMVDAYEIARDIADEVEYLYDADTSIWFSGSKGFHVITGLVGASDIANIAMKSIANRIDDRIDNAMYKSRSLFRLPNTTNSKSGLRKIQVQYNESLQSLLERAKTRQQFHTTKLVYDNWKFLYDFDHAVTNIKSKPVIKAEVIDGDWIKSLPPCINTMLDTNVPSGYRWETCFWLVRHWRLHGVDVDEAVALAANDTLFNDAGYTAGMIHHYYNSDLLSVGCKSGPISSLMQSSCCKKCIHSDGWGERITSKFIGGLDGLTSNTN